MKNGTLDEIAGKGVSYDLKSGATGITDLATIESKVQESGKAKWEEVKAKVAEAKAKIESGEIRVTNAQAGESFDKTALTNLDMPND